MMMMAQVRRVSSISLHSSPVPSAAVRPSGKVVETAAAKNRRESPVRMDPATSVCVKPVSFPSKV